MPIAQLSTEVMSILYCYRANSLTNFLGSSLHIKPWSRLECGEIYIENRLKVCSARCAHCTLIQFDLIYALNVVMHSDQLKAAHNSCR